MRMQDNGFRKLNYCPYCNHKVDSAFMPEEEANIPTPGSLAICISCAKVAIFNEEMVMTVFDTSTLDVEDHSHIVKMQYAIHGAQGQYSDEH